jgi:type I restriction enzyme S subunit
MNPWPLRTIAEIAEKVAMGPFGSSIKVGTFVTKGVPVISGQHLNDVKVADRDFNFVTEAHADQLANANVRPGDVIFTHAGNIGQVAYIDDKAAYERYVISQRQFYMRCDPSRVTPQYITYFFRSPLGQHLLLANRSSTGVPSIARPVTYLRTVSVPLPPIEEQRAIAAVLGALDDKMEQNRRTAQALERLAAAIFVAWFVNFEPVKAKAKGATSFPSMPQPVFDALPTRFGDSEIGLVPHGWEVKAIGDVVTVRGGGTPSTTNREYWDGGVHCWATPRDMSRLSQPVLLDTERHITNAGVDCISSGLLPVGTVLMSSRAPVGYLAIAGVPTAINQGFIAMVCDGPLPPVYVLNWAVNSMDTIKAHASGTTFPEISKSSFRPLPIIQPSADTVTAYQRTADALFALLAASIRESQRLAEIRDYLLPRLLSGSLRASYD